MDASTARFHNSNIVSPRGGWAFPYNGAMIEAYSEQELIDAIAKVQRNNGAYESDKAIADKIWEYYCAREPNRCADPEFAKKAVSNPPVRPREMTKEVVGPIIWNFLNLAATNWEPGSQEWFLRTLDQVTILLGCPICQGEWRTVLSTHPATAITSKKEASQWVNMVHNLVNERIGKRIYPYPQMVREFGAPE